MDRTQLQQKLERYRSDQARAEYLRRYIPLMEKRLALLKEDALQSIGRGLPPDAVRGFSGLGDPTALLGIRAAEDALTEDMRLCRDQLRRLRRESAALEAHLALMDCLLSSLTEEGRFLLTERCVERRTWPVIARDYAERYGVDYTLQTLRRRTRAVLDGLCHTWAKAG